MLRFFMIIIEIGIKFELIFCTKVSIIANMLGNHNSNIHFQIFLSERGQTTNSIAWDFFQCNENQSTCLSDFPVGDLFSENIFNSFFILTEAF